MVVESYAVIGGNKTGKSTLCNFLAKNDRWIDDVFPVTNNPFPTTLVQDYKINRMEDFAVIDYPSFNGDPEHDKTIFVDAFREAGTMIFTYDGELDTKTLEQFKYLHDCVTYFGPRDLIVTSPKTRKMIGVNIEELLSEFNAHKFFRSIKHCDLIVSSQQKNDIINPPCDVIAIIVNYGSHHEIAVHETQLKSYTPARRIARITDDDVGYVSMANAIGDTLRISLYNGFDDVFKIIDGIASWCENDVLKIRERCIEDCKAILHPALRKNIDTLREEICEQVFSCEGFIPFRKINKILCALIAPAFNTIKLTMISVPDRFSLDGKFCKYRCELVRGPTTIFSSDNDFYKKVFTDFISEGINGKS